MTVSKELQDIFRRSGQRPNAWPAETPKIGLAGVFASPETLWTRRELQNILDTGYRSMYEQTWTAAKSK